MASARAVLLVVVGLLASVAPGPAAAEGDATHHVHIEGFAYAPADLDIAAGDTVVWHNHDAVGHTATETDVAWDTGVIENEAEVGLQFGAAASYAYHCAVHPFMTGMLDVAGAANEAPSVAITSPDDGSEVAGAVTVHGTASDGDGTVASVEVRFDGGAWQAADGTDAWSFTWDTTTVADGPRSVEARATDDAGAASAIAARTVTVGNPPTVAIASPTAGATVSGVVVVQGTAADPGPGGSVASVEVRFDGGAWTLADGAAEWSLAWDTAPLTDGAHTIEARSSDGSLASALASVEVTVTHEPPPPPPPPGDEPPSVAITSPAEGASVAGTATVQGTASDPEGLLTRVEVRIDGGPWSQASGAETWTFDWDTLVFADGLRVVEARATDDGGASAVAVRNLTVANPPTVAFTSPPPDAEVASFVTLRGTASDPGAAGGVARVDVRFDGGAWTLADGGAEWTFAWDTTAADDGPHEAEARATDTAGNTATATRTLRVANPPTVRIDAPAEGAEVEGTVRVQGAASDPGPGGAVARVEVRIDGGPWLLAAGGAAWTFDWPSAGVADGEHLLEARAFDGALHSALAARRVVTDNQHADLVVSALDVTSDLAGLTSVDIAATVRNVGDEASGPFVLRVAYVGQAGAPQTITVEAVGGLAIGGEATVTIPWSTLGKVGRFVLVATADPAGQVEEHREDNNGREAALCLPSLADLGCLLPTLELL